MSEADEVIHIDVNLGQGSYRPVVVVGMVYCGRMMRGTHRRSVRGDVLQSVGLVNGALTGQALVRYVGSGLSEGTKEGGAVGPAHGQG